MATARSPLRWADNLVAKWDVDAGQCDLDLLEAKAYVDALGYQNPPDGTEPWDLDTDDAADAGSNED